LREARASRRKLMQRRKCLESERRVGYRHVFEEVLARLEVLPDAGHGGTETVGVASRERREGGGDVGGEPVPETRRQRGRPVVPAEDEQRQRACVAPDRGLRL